MANPDRIESLCTSGVLYSAAFVDNFGKTSLHWPRSTWFQREACLRHDMVCLLLCNLEEDPGIEPPSLREELEPPPVKRRRISASEPSTSSSYSGDTGEMETGDEAEQGVIGRARGIGHLLRYRLLEGLPNIAQVQNKLSELYGTPKMKRQYDIFDKAERKFLEVKVTKSFAEAKRTYECDYSDNSEYTALLHLHPETTEYSTIGKNDVMPGLAKAIDFLLRRRTYLMSLGNYMESDLHSAPDLVSQVLNCKRFNKNVEEWTKLFWEHRNKPIGSQENFSRAKVSSYIVESQLKALIEDTSKRNAPFMTFPGKILPYPFVKAIETTLDRDSEMVDLLLQDLSFQGGEPKAEIVNWAIEKWRSGEKNTFKLFTLQERSSTPPAVLKDLGIGCKGTVRNDNHDDLKQKDFGPPMKARYSAWMSNLLKEQALPNKEGVNYFTELQEREIADPHPMARIIAKVADAYFEKFGRSNVGAYCSSLKGVYSRFGGAYLGSHEKNKQKPGAVIFPIYSVGMREGETVRLITGLVIRGPQHARSATDKIPFISLELLNNDEGLRYRRFIRNSHILYDSFGRAWCYRVNSVMKGASSFITFVINSAYLPANMLGELTLGNPMNRTDYKADEEMTKYIADHGGWMMERCAESVMMSAIGSSQEEGAMAIIRKIYMLKLNWYRGGKSIGCDTPGLAEALNECLINAPFALYMGKQIRDLLDG
ncbi:PA [Aedes alboannulatus orthomyxo-like virus]|nr:PA [Aedes alboannulatus orthomyxo-like virus]